MAKIISVSVSAGDYGTISEVKIFPLGRKCKNKGCNAILSIYNPNALCHSCLQSSDLDRNSMAKSPHYHQTKEKSKYMSPEKRQAQYKKCQELWNSTITLSQNARKIGITATRAHELARRLKLEYKINGRHKRQLTHPNTKKIIHL